MTGSGARRCILGGMYGLIVFSVLLTTACEPSNPAGSSVPECVGKSRPGCFNLANELRSTGDPARAAEIYGALCDRDLPDACFNLGIMHSGAHGVAHNERLAVDLWLKACDLGDQGGCASGGAALWNGDGVPKQESKGLQLLRRACSLGDKHACHNLAVDFTKKRNFKNARKLLEKGCEKGFPQSCTLLGDFYREGKGVSKELKRAESLYDKACAAKFAGGCNNLAWVRCYDLGQCSIREEQLARGAVADKPQNAAYHDTLAFVLCALGKTEEGASAYQRSCELGLETSCDISCKP